MPGAAVAVDSEVVGCVAGALHRAHPLWHDTDVRDVDRDRLPGSPTTTSPSSLPSGAAAIAGVPPRPDTVVVTDAGANPASVNDSADCTGPSCTGVKTTSTVQEPPGSTGTVGVHVPPVTATAGSDDVIVDGTNVDGPLFTTEVHHFADGVPTMFVPTSSGRGRQLGRGGDGDDLRAGRHARPRRDELAGR